MRSGDDLDRIAFFVGAFRVSQAIESVTHVAKQPRMQSVIWLFEANDGRRLRQVGNGKQREGNECTLRKVARFDDVVAFTCAQREGALSLRRSFKQDSIEFWNPTTQLLVERFKPLWVLISKTIQNSSQVGSGMSQLHLRFKLNGVSNCGCVERKDASAVKCISGPALVPGLVPVGNFERLLGRIVHAPYDLNEELVSFLSPMCAERDGFSFGHTGSLNLAEIPLIRVAYRQDGVEGCALAASIRAYNKREAAERKLGIPQHLEVFELDP